LVRRGRLRSLDRLQQLEHLRPAADVHAFARAGDWKTVRAHLHPYLRWTTRIAARTPATSSSIVGTPRRALGEATRVGELGKASAAWEHFDARLRKLEGEPRAVERVEVVARDHVVGNVGASQRAEPSDHPEVEVERGAVEEVAPGPLEERR